MEFSTEFALLPKFSVGLLTTSKSENEVLSVSNYLGVALPGVSLDDRVRFLSEELSRHGFLSTELSSDSIYETDEYRSSRFIREIVANNRQNLKNRTVHGT